MSKRPSVQVATIGRKSPLWRPSLPQSLKQAVEDYHVEDTSDFSPLVGLSTATLLDGIEPHGEAAVVQDGQWIAPADVYVTLVYDPNGKDRTELHDSYPARIFFNVEENGTVKVSKIDVDVSPFYGPATSDDLESTSH
jgi:hypothetical protein